MEDDAKKSSSQHEPFYTILSEGEKDNKKNLQINIDPLPLAGDSNFGLDSPIAYGGVVIGFHRPNPASPSTSPDNEDKFPDKFVGYPFKQPYEIHEYLANDISRLLKRYHEKVEAIMSSQTSHHTVLVSTRLRQKEEYKKKTLYITCATDNGCNRVLMLAIGDQIPSIRTQCDQKVIYIRPNDQGKFLAWWFEDGDFKEHVIAEEYQADFKEKNGEIANKDRKKKEFDFITAKCGYIPYSIRADSMEMSRPKYLTHPQKQSLKGLLQGRRITFDLKKEKKLEDKEDLQLMRQITSIVDDTKPILKLEQGLRNRLAELYADFILQHLSNEELVRLELKESRTDAAMVTIFDRLAQDIQAVQDESYTPFQDAFRSMKEVGLGTLIILSFGAAFINGSKPLIATNNAGWDFIQILALMVISLVLNIFVNTMFNPKQIKEELVRFRALRNEITHPSKYITTIKKSSATLTLISLAWIALNGGAATGAQAIHNHASSLPAAIFVFAGVSSPYAFQRLGGLLGLFNSLWQECADRELGFSGGMKFIALDFLGLDPRNRPLRTIIERRKERACQAITMTWRIFQLIFVAPGVLLNYAGATKTGLDIFTKIFTDRSQVLDSATSTTPPISEWSTFYKIDAFISALGSFFYLLRGHGWVENFLSLQVTVNKYVELRKLNSILKKELIEKEQEKEKKIEKDKKPRDNFIYTSILSRRHDDDQTTPLLSITTTSSSSSKCNLPSWTRMDLEKGVPLLFLVLAAFSPVGLGLAAYDQADSVSNDKSFKILCGIGCALAVFFLNFLAVSKKLKVTYKRHIGIEKNRQIFYRRGIACDSDEAVRALRAISCIGDLKNKRMQLQPSPDKDQDDNHERHPRGSSVITMSSTH